MSPVLVAVVVLLVGTGALMAVVGLVPVQAQASPRRAVRRLLPAPGTLLGPRPAVAVAAAVAGLVAGALTGWWVLVLAAPAAVVWLPALFRGDDGEQVQRLSDLESWLRGLSGTLVGGSVGLRQALRDSAPSAPKTLRPSLARLSARLDAQQPTPEALHEWADDLDDPAADLAVACLKLEAGRRAGAVSPSLERVADTVAELAANRRAVEADRKGPRSSVKWVTVISAVMMVALLTRPAFSAFYTTALGQVAAAVLLAAYGGCLAWMRKVAQGKVVTRFLPDERGQGS